MKKTLLVLALVVSFAIAPNAQACSPAMDWPPSALDNLAQHSIAFVGTVTGVSQDKSINGEYHITFKVEKSYKGSLEDTITVRARSSSAACGYDDGYKSFEKGSVWVIYGTGASASEYMTSSLSLNSQYSSVGAAIKALTLAGITSADEGPVMCTMQYQPVCGKDATGAIKTFGNSCTLGAEKGTFLYAGECTTGATPPAKDLWTGSKGTDVTWLQTFLISKGSGAATLSLTSAGATGYFGVLTRAALAEFQRTHAIAPTLGYFGAKTRAAITSLWAPQTTTFTGKISAVDTACFADGVCSVTVDGKKVVLLAGMRIGTIPPVGTLKGVESIGDLEAKIGSKAEVYATPTKENGADYTLYGSTAYYVKVLD